MRSEVVSMCIHPPAIEENTTSGGVTSHSEMPWGLRDVNPKAWRIFSAQQWTNIIECFIAGKKLSSLIWERSVAVKMTGISFISAAQGHIVPSRGFFKANS